MLIAAVYQPLMSAAVSLSNKDFPMARIRELKREWFMRRMWWIEYNPKLRLWICLGNGLYGALMQKALQFTCFAEWTEVADNSRQAMPACMLIKKTIVFRFVKWPSVFYSILMGQTREVRSVGRIPRCWMVELKCPICCMLVNPKQ